MKKKAIILLSGGLDSSTCLAIARNQGFQCIALSFDYGQRHAVELTAAKRIAQSLGASEHHIVHLDIGQFGASALTDSRIDVPIHQQGTEIPLTYVPARNTVFLSMALGLAEAVDARDIFIGVSSIDYSHYPDCRPQFIKAFEQLANIATKAGVEGDLFRIHAPLQHLTKAETIRVGTKLGVDYALTISCYQANQEGEACGQCDSCVLRKQGFQQAGIPDPSHYSQ